MQRKQSKNQCEVTPLNIIVCGATGVGKTDFCLALARAISGEIINADMGQFYVPLTIGTAKPDWRNSDIAHHLFDIIAEPVDFTVVSYRQLVEETIDKIMAQCKVPIIVGGSTLYISSLFFPPVSKASVVKDPAEIPLHDDQLWDYLCAIDPERAYHIHPRDWYRLRRALDIWRSTKIRPSLFKPLFAPIAPFILVILNRDREDLYQRINHRVQVMIDQGWIEEVAALIHSPWRKFLLKKKLIGYDNIIYYLGQPKKERDPNALIGIIAQKTRNYAKRQVSFWRMLEKKVSGSLKNCPHSAIYSVNLSTQNEEHYVSKLTSLVKGIHGSFGKKD